MGMRAKKLCLLGTAIPRSVQQNKRKIGTDFFLQPASGSVL